MHDASTGLKCACEGGLARGASVFTGEELPQGAPGSSVWAQNRHTWSGPGPRWGAKLTLPLEAEQPSRAQLNQPNHRQPADASE